MSLLRPLLPLAFAALAFGASGPNDSAIGPDYVPAPEMTAKPGVPKGTIKEFTMLSTESPAYPGIAKNKPGEVVPYKRKVQVYIPAQYDAGQPARLLLVTDGPWYQARRDRARQPHRRQARPGAGRRAGRIRRRRQQR